MIHGHALAGPTPHASPSLWLGGWGVGVDTPPLVGAVGVVGCGALPLCVCG